MSLAQLKERLPEYAKDLKLNLSVIGGPGELSPQQSWGTALAAAVSSRNPEVVAAIAADAAPHLSETAANAARAAASVMAMNNVYYRFTHFMAGTDYAKLPAKLRMHVIGNPGVDKLDFELWCLASSAVTGCESCVTSHDKVVRDKGATPGMVHDAVRIASVVHALAVTLEAAAPAAPRG